MFDDTISAADIKMRHKRREDGLNRDKVQIWKEECLAALNELSQHGLSRDKVQIWKKEGLAL
jgi:hypothetical protein